jgi:hypothetical protein
MGIGFPHVTDHFSGEFLTPTAAAGGGMNTE